MQRRRRRGEGVGTRGWGQGGGGDALGRVSVPPAISASVGARGRRAPARCALRPARSGSSPDAPPPPPPRVRRLHFLFL